MGKNQHVVPHNDKWAEKGSDNSKATKITRTQQEAIDIAREISLNQQSELIIHRPNGQIRKKTVPLKISSHQGDNLFNRRRGQSPFFK